MSLKLVDCARLSLLAVVALGAVACSGASEPAPEPVPDAVEVAPAAARPATCPPPSEGAAEAAAKGELLWAAAQDGEHVTADGYSAAVAQLRVAAEGGDVDAQYNLGHRMFSTTFQREAPKADNDAQKAVFVEAMSWIAVAAQRGQPSAKTALSPWLLSALANPEADVKPDADDVLAVIPAAWVHEAAVRAASLEHCW